MEERHFLLEIGCEELPADYIRPALEDLRKKGLYLFQEAHLIHGEISVYGTPRRLALLVKGLLDRQEDIEEEIKGPPARASFSNGQPTNAARGFAKAHGMEVRDLSIKETEKGEYLFLLKRHPGRPTKEILPGMIPSLVKGISFPKTMRWGQEDFPFARPIRWLVVLYGSEVVDVKISGICSGNKSRGLRFFYPSPVTIEDPSLYLETLKEVKVIVHHGERRRMIEEQLQEIAGEYHTTGFFHEDLIEENTFLVEYPTAFVGQFNPEYLELPQDVLKNAMQEHQRYFPLQDKEKGLRPYFIGIRNGGMESLPRIIQGNEKVIEARLSDARFFFHEDQRKTLEARGEDLKKVLFHEELGSLYHKLERMSYLATDLSRQFGLDTRTEEKIKRAVRLSKADLTTEMVKEFPKLQGIIGQEYALLMGEDTEVAKAIGEQYLPRFGEDNLPESIEGSLLSLVDKLDTIVASFSIGLIPKSSQDPYGLRRQGHGIIRITLRRELEYSLKEFVRTNLKLLQGQGFVKNSIEEKEEMILSFFQKRMERYFLGEGYDHDIVTSLLQGGIDSINQIYRKGVSLNEYRNQGRLNPLVVALTRAYRLSKEKELGEDLREDLFTEEGEMRLYRVFRGMASTFGQAIKRGDYSGALLLLESLIEPIASFFEDVLVMVEDEDLRRNRLLLLKKIACLYSPLGDLESLVIEDQKK